MKILLQREDFYNLEIRDVLWTQVAFQVISQILIILKILSLSISLKKNKTSKKKA